MSAFAKIFDTHRMATDDGPGMRTTLFLKGCPLNCRWCHNPEGISMRPQVWWWEKKCIGCGHCVEACSVGAVSLDENGVHIDRETCTGCGACARACPSTAMEYLGEEWTVEKALKYVLKDRLFYERSGGGVTLSGGEPTLYPDFAFELFSALKAEGVHTALDTCGLARWEIYERLLPVTDLFLWDIKTLDPDAHRRFTEVSNEEILRNLERLAEILRSDENTRLWIRTPLIPRMTADPETVRRIARYLDERLADVVERWDLCAFNGSCTPKYRRLGREWEFADDPPLTRSEADRLRRAVEETAPRIAERARITGILRKDEQTEER